MMKLILTPQQSAVVATEWREGCRLEPQELVDRTWSLPAAVLDDPDYFWVRASLAQCPIRNVDETELMNYQPPED